jgi:hypothetical protein
LFGIWGWSQDLKVWTDATGRIDVEMPWVAPGVVYALRVYASRRSAPPLRSSRLSTTSARWAIRSWPSWKFRADYFQNAVLRTVPLGTLSGDFPSLEKTYPE